ncbi:hypothetical protein GCM10008932_07010 [Alkalibacterium iburiense]|uniref:Heparinase II/III-like C-terminal domain-containing protein n=1 Tax=Alkalibacterium iburiense TaxID=290589 RepID=A0ABN0X6X0_9LACT
MDQLKINKNEQYDAFMTYLKKDTVHVEEDNPYPDFSAYTLFFEEGDRVTFEKQYFNRRKKLTRLGLLCLDDSSNKKRVRELENSLFSICQEFTWCLPAHIDTDREENSEQKQYTLDLFACETAFTLAEICHYLSDVLSPKLKAIVRSSIFERVLNPYLKEEWGWEKLDNNWASVCAGSIGITAIYMIKDQSVLKTVLKRVEKTMACFLDGFGEDGACLEGLSYWQYGFRYFTYFSDAYKNYTKGSKNLFNKPKIKEIAKFQQVMTLTDNQVLNYSDSPDVLEPAHDLAGYYHTLYPETIILPEKNYDITQVIDHCGRWGPALRTLMWSKREKDGSDYPIEESYWLSDAQIFVYKHKHLHFSFKGGDNNESHNHNDLGHFILHFQGQPVFIDLGAPVYTRDYFNDNRYSILQASSKGHSVPIINGKTQEEGESYKARMQDRKGYERLSLDLTDAYLVESLKQYRRTFSLQPIKQELIIEEEFHFMTQENALELRYMLDGFPLVEEEKKRIIFSKNQIQVVLQLPEGIDHYLVEAIEYVNHKGENKQAQVVRLFVEPRTHKAHYQLTVSCQKL